MMKSKVCLIRHSAFLLVKPLSNSVGQAKMPYTFAFQDQEGWHAIRWAAHGKESHTNNKTKEC